MSRIDGRPSMEPVVGGSPPWRPRSGVIRFKGCRGDGMGLAIHEQGRGHEVVVVLNAMWAPREYVQSLVNALAARWRVLTVSYPGYDGTPAHRAAWSCDVDRELLE